MSTNLVIAVSGATASGKSTFAGMLCNSLSDLSPVLLKQDHYFRDFHEFAPAERETVVTSNHPSAVLWDDLIAHVSALKIGKTVRVPVEGTRAFDRGVEPEVVEATGVTIVDGHLLFTEGRLIDLADLIVFVDTNVHERVVRRLLRDTAYGSTCLEGATRWYRRDVIPNVSRYSESRIRDADIIIPFDRRNEVGAEAVANWVRGSHRPSK